MGLNRLFPLFKGERNQLYDKHSVVPSVKIIKLTESEVERVADGVVATFLQVYKMHLDVH